jgi:hypothetical protein
MITWSIIPLLSEPVFPVCFDNLMRDFFRIIPLLLIIKSMNQRII